MKKLMIAMTAAATMLPTLAATPASAQRGWYPERYYRPGPVYVMHRGDRIYRGRDGRYYCRRSDGSTGLVVGAALGAVVGNSVRLGGSSTLGTILGGAAGAALGSSIDRGRLRCR